MAVVIHHYAAGGNSPRTYDVPPRSCIRAALIRQGQPTVYVEKPVEAKGGGLTLQAAFYPTGQSFDPGDMFYVDTVSEDGFVWHVYARIGE